MSDVILVSSDDEFENPPPKKLKTGAIGTVLAQLNKLKEISAAPCETSDKKINGSKTQDSDITIIIESDEKKENDIVSLLDESLEENAIEQKDNNVSSDCLIVGSDSETEDDLDTSNKPITQENITVTQNGIEENANDPNETELDKPQTDHDSNETELDKPQIDRDSKETELEKRQIQSEENQNKDSPNIESNDILNRPSTSTASDAHKLLDEFLETCGKSLRGSKYESRVLPVFPKMKASFEKCNSVHKEPSFIKMLQEHIATVKISAPEAVVGFQRLYTYLKDQINGESVVVEEDHLPKLKILEKTCKKLVRKLKKLEDAEVNFEDEEDSSYLQIDRYSQRLNQVYQKYCQLLNKSPYSGRLLYERLQFVHSKYNEINRAVTKSYATNKFPTYNNIEKCVRKCVTKHNLGLSESEIKEESKNCFTKMGNLLQMRRKKELYEVHCGFITLNEDPANTDENLKTKLQNSLLDGDQKMRELVQKYVNMQENNVSVEVSEDSDDSNYKDSESESEA